MTQAFRHPSVQPVVLSFTQIPAPSTPITQTKLGQLPTSPLHHPYHNPNLLITQTLPPPLLDSYFWHCCLGHVSDEVVKSFLRSFVPSFNIKSWRPFFCESCKTSKSKCRRRPIPEIIPRDQKIDLLVSDVLGPLDPDINGNQYILTVRDHHTTFSVAFPMSHRSLVPKLLTNLLSKIQTRFSRSPKFLRCDNAQEYKSQSLLTHAASLGTQIIYSSPYTPEQNGEAECLNKTLGDMARTMLIHSRLPKNLWSFAYRCACWIANRIPNSRVPNSTPLQLWSGHNPNPDFLFPFGAKASVHIPQSLRRKLDSQAWIGHLVGYQDDGRGWIFYNPITQKLQASDCATFLDFKGYPLLNESDCSVTIRQALTLGQVPTKEICEA